MKNNTNSNTSKKGTSYLMKMVQYLHDHIQAMNGSKVFAGLMIITLNIASKFVNIKLGKSLEAYIKYSFSKQLLVFVIAWMGTRDIYIALIVCFLFYIITEYLLNEESMFFILPKHVHDHHLSLLENDEKVSDEDIKRAKEILEKAEKQKELENGKLNVNRVKTNNKKNEENFEPFSFR